MPLCLALQSKIRQSRLLKQLFSQGVHKMPYIFVAASIISVLLVVILFKITIKKIKEDPKAAGHAQTRFFIGVAISEIIPIILIAYGMMNIEQVTDITELYVPGLIIILTVAIALFFVILQKAVSGDRKSTRLNSSHVAISYAVFCLKKKKKRIKRIIQDMTDFSMN